jgi:hypothetical protein
MFLATVLFGECETVEACLISSMLSLFCDVSGLASTLEGMVLTQQLLPFRTRSSVPLPIGSSVLAAMVKETIIVLRVL